MINPIIFKINVLVWNMANGQYGNGNESLASGSATYRSLKLIILNNGPVFPTIYPVASFRNYNPISISYLKCYLTL